MPLPTRHFRSSRRLGRRACPAATAVLDRPGTVTTASETSAVASAFAQIISGLEPGGQASSLSRADEMRRRTTEREFSPDVAECPTFVNADLIAAGTSPLNP